MVREAAWTPRRIGKRDIINGSMVRAQYTPAKYHGIKRRYLRFCRLNGKTVEQGLEPWIGQMMSARLSPGSIDTYFHSVIRSIPALFNSMEARQLQAVTAAYHTHQGGRGHAPDVEDQAKRIISHAMMNSDLANEIWVCYVTGMRASCVSHLQEDSVELTRKFLTLKVRFTKGIRRARKRREVDFPLEGLVPAPKSFKKVLGGRSTKCVFNVSAAKMNLVLKKSCEHLGVKTITSGTLRRLYSNRITPYCKANNIPKALMMLHSYEDMDQAFYSFDNKKAK